MPAEILLEYYDPASEITVLGVCLVMAVLLVVSFKVRLKTFRIFISALGMLITATMADLMLHYLADSPGTSDTVLYLLRSIYHIMLFAILHQFTAYICAATALPQRARRPWMLAAAALLVIFSAADTVGIFTGHSMRISEGGGIGFEGSVVFAAGYVLNLLLIFTVFIRARHRLYKRVMLGFTLVTAISLTVLAAARIRAQSTFTAATFLFPLIAIMYLMHSNPYDAQLGTNDLRGLNNLIRYNDEERKDFLFMSLYMRELDGNSKAMPEELRTLVREVVTTSFRKSALFKVSPGHMLLIVPKDRNPDYAERVPKILETFRNEYERFRYDYKMVIGESSRELTRRNEYVAFIRSIHTRMEENTIHTVQPDDLKKFREYERILRELEDIAEKKNPEDPRVLVYCQPVYNIRSGKYDTAESLMRLRPDGLGIIPPDRFIPLAEEHGYIHALTEIVLSKTCRALRNLLAEGYEITRISVNVSALELREQGFCGDISRIIGENGVDIGRIAIELTESRSDSDFLMMKERIGELKEKGVTFYLDDFGTGYSNMERILELPFDIIKFDRSLVAAGGQSKRSEQILGSLADLLCKLQYSVLYEGVEDEKDEMMCRGLNASYLQGYKYSRPIPISELRRFLARAS